MVVTAATINITPIADDPKRIGLTFPANYSNFVDGTNSVKPEVHQLLFPAAKEYLRKFKTTYVLTEANAWNVESIQSMLTVREHLYGLQKQLEVVKAYEEALRDKLLMDRELIAKLKTRNNELATYAAKKSEEVLDAAAYYIFKTRAELMKEFKEGKSEKWDLEAKIKAFDEDFGNITPPRVDDGFDLIAFGDCMDLAKKDKDSYILLNQAKTN